jgi:thymidylate kinase
VIQELVTTFKKKIDVYQVYMGCGKSGTISWQRKILKGLKKSYGKNTQKSIKAPQDPFISDPKRSFKSNLFRCVEAIAVARERRRKVKRIQAAKRKGMLVICDRFPQNQLTGYNDGPMLTSLLDSPNFLFRFLAKKEARVHHLAEDNPPDLVFKLIADAEVIAARKPSMVSLKALEQKIEGVRNLQFAGDCSVVTIDATKPLTHVVTSIKTALWTAWE